MPKLQATTTQTVTTEVILAPKLKQKLLAELKLYAEVSTQRKQLDEAMGVLRDNIDALRDETGEKSLAIDGFKVTLVEPVRSSLDKKKLIAQGVTLAQIEAATTIQPGKAYVKVSVPGQKDEG